jgi:5'-nucleotidase
MTIKNTAASAQEMHENALISQFDWILFDADNTLFHFNDYEGFKQLLNQYKLPIKENDFSDYKKLNTELWQAFERGEISANDIASQRFSKWAQVAQKTSEELNQHFLQIMVSACTPMPGVYQLLDFLKGKVKCAIITNGFEALQHERLKHHQLSSAFEFVLSSEKANSAKPNQPIFSQAFALMDQPARERVLMVGDNPHSDIVGGNNYGIYTCWLNSDNKIVPASIQPDFEISGLKELGDILANQNALPQKILG